MKTLKNIRKQLGLSQDEMAVFLGSNWSLLSMAERGLRKVDTPALITIAKVSHFIYESKKVKRPLSFLPASNSQLILLREKLLLQKRNNNSRRIILGYIIEDINEKMSKYQLLQELIAYLSATGIDPKNLTGIKISVTIHADLMKAEQEMMRLQVEQNFIELSLEKLQQSSICENPIIT